jgi:DNA-binding transcriptional ArsR family regulator
MLIRERMRRSGRRLSGPVSRPFPGLFVTPASQMNHEDYAVSLPSTQDLKCSSDLEKIIDRAKTASDFLKAIAHESRLLILCILAEGEKSVTELEELLSLRQPTVSQQLARLRMDKLVSTRREGKTVFYSLANEDARKIIESVYDVFCRD